MITRDKTEKKNLKNKPKLGKKWEEIQIYRDFKKLTEEIVQKKPGNGFKRKTLLQKQICTQNNDITTNYIKAKIDDIQQNSKYRKKTKWLIPLLISYS